MNILRYLHPHLVIEIRDSKFSGQISVISEFGNLRIWAGGIPQTGGIVDLILKKHLRHFTSPKRALLLGLGGGGILHYFHHQFPQAHLTAVEIDPVMIDLAKKYFHISDLTVSIHQADATEFISQTTRESFDAIIVDCYLGSQIPQSLQSNEFLQDLSRVLTSDGTITFNRLNDKSNHESNRQFLDKLNQAFASIETFRNYSNLLVVARNVSPIS